jgi:hypothetical protein
MLAYILLFIGGASVGVALGALMTCNGMEDLQVRIFNLRRSLMNIKLVDYSDGLEYKLSVRKIAGNALKADDE